MVMPAPVIVVTLQGRAGVDPMPALRRLLKYAGRVCGLACVKISANEPQDAKPAGDRAGTTQRACGPRH
jgi:hypothetical protein